MKKKGDYENLLMGYIKDEELSNKKLEDLNREKTKKELSSQQKQTKLLNFMQEKKREEEKISEVLITLKKEEKKLDPQLAELTKDEESNEVKIDAILSLMKFLEKTKIILEELESKQDLTQVEINDNFSLLENINTKTNFSICPSEDYNFADSLETDNKQESMISIQ